MCHSALYAGLCVHWYPVLSQLGQAGSQGSIVCVWGGEGSKHKANWVELNRAR